MILAAPLVIPFSQAVPALAGLTGLLGMAALSDKVNEYIQDNPEESMKILSMLIPGAGIGQIFMNKEKISLEDLDEMTDEEAQDLSKEEKAELMKQGGKSKSKDKRQTMIDLSEKLGLSSEGKEKQDIEYEIDERYDEGGVEDAPKPKFDYKKFFRNRRADGGSVGIASMMPSKKIKGQDHILAYITPKEADKLVALGGKETMTKEGILAYPEFDNYGYSSQQDFDQGNYGRSNDPTVSSYAGGNNLTDQTNVNKKITEEINKKLNELKPPVIDYTKQKFDNLEKFRTLKKSPISFAPFRFERPKNINKTLFDSTISELALSYPDLDITNEFGTVNTDNLKTAIDSAVLKGDLSPIDGLTLTQSITTQGDPSSIGLSYDNNLVNFSTPNINEGDYTLGTNYQIGDLGVGSMFDVKNDSLAKKNLSFNYGDGTLKGSQVTYPGSNFQTNELGLNKNFNVTDNIDVNVKGDLSNLKMDGSTLYTDKSLTPTVTYKTNIGDGSLSLSGGKEIIGGGVKPDVGLNFSYPTSDTGKIGLTTDNLLSKDRTGNLSYTKNIGNYGDNTFLDASVEVDPFNTNQYTGMLKFQKKFADGGRVGLFMGGPALEGQALSIYDSMKAYNFSDQEIANALSAQGLYTAGGTTDTPDTTIQPIGFQSGNGGGGGITELTPLNTRTNISSGINRNDKTFIDPLNEKIANQMTIQNPNLNKYTTEEIVSMNPDMFNIKTDKGFIGNTIDNFKTMGGNLIDKFSGSKVGQGATKFKNMAFTPMMALMQKRNPLNPNASNYNPNLQPQMDFLEGITGSKITGTSGNLKTTDGLAMIGRDPNSGLTKYGPGSVLSGQNVVSGFGTNDYESQLQGYIDKMIERRTKGVLSEFQQAKLDAAYAELKAEQERAAAAAAKSAAEEIALAKSYNIGQRGGGAGDSSTSHMGGISQAQADAVGKANKEAGMSGWGLRDGGLATMFKEKR